MARSRNPNKRGTRLWSPISGTTFYTQPSGVTIDSTSGFAVAAGTVSPTELSYLDGASGDILACDKGTGFSLTGASVPWAGTTLQASHGFTVLQGVNAIYSTETNASGISPVTCHIVQSVGGDVNSTVSIVAKVISNAGAVNILAASGGTVFWMAFGI